MEVSSVQPTGSTHKSRSIPSRFPRAATRRRTAGGGPDSADAPSDPELDSLLVAARAGSSTATERIIGRFRPLVVATASLHRNWLPASVELSDLQQEAVLAICELIPAFDPDKGVAFPTAAKLAVAYRVRRYVRLEAKRGGQGEEQQLKLRSLVEEAVCGQRSLDPTAANPRVRSALRQLTPRQRALIANLYWRDRSPGEIARESNTTVQAVSALRRRAEDELRAALERNEPSAD
jgi:RNA polymerase sigma factor (sigma-70 family)